MSKEPPSLQAGQPGIDRPEPSEPVDTDALFRTLVTKHRTRLHRFIVRYIGQSDDAEDIAQQAFLEAARTIERFRGESELSTWLYGIAMNLVRNYLNRAPHRVHRFESDEVLESFCAPEGDPSDIVDMQQTMRMLTESMAELPAEMREVLTLVAIDEVCYEEAAAILSIPIGTVRSRLSRARAALRSRLGGAGVQVSY